MNEVRNTRVFLGAFLLLSLLFAVTSVSALTFNNPTNGQTITGNVTFNVTAALANALNCTFATTGDSFFAFVANTTAGQNNFTNSNNTALLTASASTTLNATCSNASTRDSAVITIGIDNTVPVCGFSVDRENVKHLDQLGISTTQSSTDLTTLTYNWRLYDPNNNVKSNPTTAAPTFSGTDVDALGEFQLALTVTDAASLNTVCTNQSIFVRSDSDSEVITTATTAVQKEQRDLKLTIFGILGAVLFLALIVIVAVVLISASKKSR